MEHSWKKHSNRSECRYWIRCSNQGRCYYRFWLRHRSESENREQDKASSECCHYHDVVIGEDCVFHANSVVGSDGFGYEFDENIRSL